MGTISYAIVRISINQSGVHGVSDKGLARVRWFWRRFVALYGPFFFWGGTEAILPGSIFKFLFRCLVCVSSVSQNLDPCKQKCGYIVHVDLSLIPVASYRSWFAKGGPKVVRDYPIWYNMMSSNCLFFFRQKLMEVVHFGKLLVHLHFNDFCGRASNFQELHSSLKATAVADVADVFTSGDPQRISAMILWISSRLKENFEKNPRSCSRPRPYFQGGQLLLVLRTGKFHLPRWYGVDFNTVFFWRDLIKFAKNMTGTGRQSMDGGNTLWTMLLGDVFNGVST